MVRGLLFVVCCSWFVVRGLLFVVWGLGFGVLVDRVDTEDRACKSYSSVGRVYPVHYNNKPQTTNNKPRTTNHSPLYPSSSGIDRSRCPVSRNTALAMAAPIGPRGGSPTAPGASAFSRMTTSISLGASRICAIR